MVNLTVGEAAGVEEFDTDLEATFFVEMSRIPSVISQALMVIACLDSSMSFRHQNSVAARVQGRSVEEQLGKTANEVNPD